MPYKISRSLILALPFFSAFAHAYNIDDRVTSEAPIVIGSNTKIALNIIPAQNLTVADIKTRGTILARYQLSGDMVAIGMTNPNSDYPYCTTMRGQTNNENEVEACLNETYNEFKVGSNTYYGMGAGDFAVRTGNDNFLAGARVAPDTYVLAMEAIQYTM